MSQFNAVYNNAVFEIHDDGLHLNGNLIIPAELILRPVTVHGSTSSENRTIDLRLITKNPVTITAQAKQITTVNGPSMHSHVKGIAEVIEEAATVRPEEVKEAIKEALASHRTVFQKDEKGNFYRKDYFTDDESDDSTR